MKGETPIALLERPAVGDLGPAPAPLERELRRFQRFYEALPDRRNLFFMFFTSGLLHWVAKSSWLVPPEVNLVLAGSALSPAERDWVERNLGRPFHHIEIAVDDRTVWEFLFQTCRHSFGWIDIDCFVINPGLFQEITALAPGTAANCAFSFHRHGVVVPLTFFVFLDVDAIRAVTETVAVSPAVYGYERFRTGGRDGASFSRVLSPELIALLRQVLPVGSDGRPVFMSEPGSFDTLQVYHLAAAALGYRIGLIRPLSVQDASDEIVHVGKVSYYQNGVAHLDSVERRRQFALLLQTDYFVLAGLCDRLPPEYGARRRELEEKLAEMEATTDMNEIRGLMRRALGARGAGDAAFTRISGDHPGL